MMRCVRGKARQHEERNIRKKKIKKKVKKQMKTKKGREEGFRTLESRRTSNFSFV